ncbi:addiction module protein [Acidovorax sp.]|uniref:addiction module protein n=1 Tax=Acidovorax sp. TaxID=1872122 RepID=UPI003D0639B1
MPANANAISAQALQLPPDERMALVERILDSLDVADPALSSLWTQESQNRLAAFRRSELQAVDMKDVIAKYQVPGRSA